jgi:nucleoside-diphosphate-sugar epimerase
LVSLSDRVLITGGSGFTGRPLVKRLRRDGHEVVALAHEGSDAGQGISDTGLLNVDLRDFDGLTKALLHIHPGAIVHLAGIAEPAYGNVGDIYLANVVGTANLFASLTAARIEPRIVILASSAHVYQIADGKPLTEYDPVRPKTHYGISKRATEDIAAIYSDRFPIIITRPFNYTGPGQTTNFLVPRIVSHYVEHRSEIRLGNLDLFRDYSDITRVVEAYSRLLSGSVGPTTTNICSGRALYLVDILKFMNELSGYPIRVVTDPLLVRSGEPHCIVGSPARLESLVGPLPNPEFRETLTRMYNEFSDQQALVNAVVRSSKTS